MERFHPGQCEATEWGKRYRQNLKPQSFFGHNHDWTMAKDKNWGPWSCCGGAANSPGCQERPIITPKKPSLMQQSSAAPKGVGAYIQFLINEHSTVLVEDESKNRWMLQGGRTAKKTTEGTSWMWLEDFKKRK
jgi:hypothetical protein